MKNLLLFFSFGVLAVNSFASTDDDFLDSSVEEEIVTETPVETEIETTNVDYETEE